MHYQLDVSYEYQSVKTKFFRLSLLFSFILTAVILTDVLLVTLTKEDYLVSLIIAIVITILFSWFAIFFFTNIYSDVNNVYRYFKGYDSGLKPTDEVMFMRQDSQMVRVNGLYVYPVHVKYVSNLDSQEKVIFSFKEHLRFEEGDKLTVTTYQRVLISAEKHK